MVLPGEKTLLEITDGQSNVDVALWRIRIHVKGWQLERLHWDLPAFDGESVITI